MQVEPRDISSRECASSSSAASGPSPSRRASSSRWRSRRARPDRIYTDPQRLQQVLKNLLVERLQVHRARHGEPAGSGGATEGTRFDDEALLRGRAVARVRGHRHRHRHRQRQAEAHLRGLPAGRRHHQPQIRRNGPRPLDQPRNRAAAGRRDPGRQQPGHREHLHALPPRALRGGRAGDARRSPSTPPYDALPERSARVAPRARQPHRLGKPRADRAGGRRW